MNTETKPTLEQVAALDGAELDYWTGVAAGIEVNLRNPGPDMVVMEGPEFYAPSIHWRTCGPLIERFGLKIKPYYGDWLVTIDSGKYGFYKNHRAGTPMIAICRAVVTRWLTNQQAD